LRVPSKLNNVSGKGLTWDYHRIGYL
jgi:hypothetical protein